MWNRYSIINDYEHFLVVDKHGRIFGKFPNIYQAENFLKYCYTSDYNDDNENTRFKSKNEIRAEKLRTDRKKKFDIIFNDTEQ